MAKLKFGSPAWRAKYLKNGPKRKRKNTAKRKTPKRKPRRPFVTGREIRRGENRGKALPVRSNPPRTWTKVKAVRVVRRGGKDILEIKK